MLLVLVLFSLCQGKYPLPISHVFLCFSGGKIPDIHRTILLNIRLPRIAGAVLIGMSLASSGTAYQSMFMNPLVSPGILGVLSGAGFGAALGMVLGDNWFVVQASAFIFGLGAAMIAVFLGGHYRGPRILMLVLGGIVSSSMFTALLSLIKYLADPNDKLPAITYWLMGGLSMVTLESLLIVSPIISISIIIMNIFAKHLNLLSMGDDEASTLGIHPGRTRFIVISAATFACVASVCVSGVIGWIGLLTPHIGRLIIGPDNRNLLRVSGLIGAILLLMADNLSRLWLPVELPLGITTSLFGIPFFAYCLRRVRGTA